MLSQVGTRYHIHWDGYSLVKFPCWPGSKIPQIMTRVMIYCQFVQTCWEEGTRREEKERGKGEGGEDAMLQTNCLGMLTLTWHGGSHGSQKREEMESGSHCG